MTFLTLVCWWHWLMVVMQPKKFNWNANIHIKTMNSDLHSMAWDAALMVLLIFCSSFCCCSFLSWFLFIQFSHFCTFFCCFSQSTALTFIGHKWIRKLSVWINYVHFERMKNLSSSIELKQFTQHAPIVNHYRTNMMETKKPSIHRRIEREREKALREGAWR